MIQHSHVCVHVVEVVRIGWVVFLCPVPRQRAVQVKDMLLWFGLVVHAVETHNLRDDKKERHESPWSHFGTTCTDEAGASYVLEEEVQLRVAAGGDGDLEQGREDVFQHLLEGTQLLL